MEPTNDHERTIAEAVDKAFLEDASNRDLIQDIAMSLDFVMSRTDTQFLVEYAYWRRANQISPASLK